MPRGADVDRLYDLFDRLRERVGGCRRLKDCDGYMDWPDRGVYFVFAAGETRTGSGQRRLTRVGTHAVSAGSSTTLWNRLKSHHGTGSGSSAHPHGGNHRGSVFRLRVGETLAERHRLHGEYPDWGTRSAALDRERAEVRDEEYPLERRVSTYVRELPFLWVALDDEPGPDSQRAFVERNAIALASNYGRSAIDPRDDCWLGRASPSAGIAASGLWNVDHVEAECDPAFLDVLETAVENTSPP